MLDSLTKPSSSAEADFQLYSNQIVTGKDLESDTLNKNDFIADKDDLNSQQLEWNKKCTSNKPKNANAKLEINKVGTQQL